MSTFLPYSLSSQRAIEKNFLVWFYFLVVTFEPAGILLRNHFNKQNLMLCYSVMLYKVVLTLLTSVDETVVRDDSKKIYRAVPSLGTL